MALEHGPAIASLIGLPVAEVVASPFGLRMCAMGAAVGASAVPHETRRVLPWHRSLRPEIDETEEGRWQDGVLTTSKYQQFAADAPRVVHRPEQHAKWTPHELLHRACGYFFRADVSRFELYLGARLNELLPVATWYGLEHHLRLDETGPFDRTRIDRHEASPSPFWLTAPRAALVERSIAMAEIAREGLAHAERELAACRHDLRRGDVTTVRHAHAFLDAASDALGYVGTHRARLRAPAVAAVHVALRVADRRIGRYLARIEAVHEVLLGGAIALSLPAVQAAIARRRRWDHALRHAETRPTDVEGALAILRGAEPSRAIALDGERPDLAQLAAGLSATLPVTSARVPGLPKILASSPALWARAGLGERTARALSDRPADADLARLEGLLAVRRAPDDRVELLEEGRPVGSRWIVSRAFELARFSTDPLSLLEGGPVRPVPSAALVGRFRGRTLLVPLSMADADAFARGDVRALPHAVREELAAAGALLAL